MLNLEEQKERLEEEKKELMEELKLVSIKSEKGNYSPKENLQDLDDVDDLADTAIELADFDNNHTIMVELQRQLEDVEDALEKIEKNEYGKCEVCGSDISDERLKLLPSARTCREHME